MKRSDAEALQMYGKEGGIQVESTNQGDIYAVAFDDVFTTDLGYGFRKLQEARKKKGREAPLTRAQLAAMGKVVDGIGRAVDHIGLYLATGTVRP